MKEKDGEPETDLNIGLTCGITTWHIRFLCDDPSLVDKKGKFAGGLGYTIEEVANMTLDQVFFLLADKKILKSKKHRTSSIDPLQASHTISKDGQIKGGIGVPDRTPLR